MMQVAALRSSQRGQTIRRIWSSCIVAFLLFFGPAVAHSTPVNRVAAQTAGTYTNPVIPQNLADPSVIKALDGYYYLAASSDFWEGGGYHILPIFRSTDLVHWTFVTDAFHDRPSWTAGDAGLWAPDLQYFHHQYYMYYTASWTKPLSRYQTSGGSAIGVATAPTPAGPWTDAGDSAGNGLSSGPIVPPRSCVFNTDPGCYYWTFDPAEFTNQDGQRFLYYGSYFGGTLVQRLSDDGLHLVGGATQIGHWDRYEGTYVIRHDVNGQPYYYNFSSSADCCRGPNTGYSVVVNRATSPMGTFVDQNGFPMLQPGSTPAPTTRPSYDPGGDNKGAQGGGFPTLKQNGNKWHGTGHNALITDLSGHQWIVYHGVDRNNGWVNGDPNFDITFRQVLLDRIDWTTDGWPVVNGGLGPSEVNTSPVTKPLVGDNFNLPNGCGAPGSGIPFGSGWRPVSGAWSVNAGTCTTGGFVQQTSPIGTSLLVSQASAPPSSRTECDLRLSQSSLSGRYGCVVSYQPSRGNGGTRYVAAWIDPARKALITGMYVNGHSISSEQSTPLPANFDYSDWHHLAIDEDLSRQGVVQLRVTLSDRNRDPLAVQLRYLPAAFGNRDGNIGFITQNTRADFDNISSALLTNDIVPAQSTPPVGNLLPGYSDEFNGTLGPQWNWVREDPSKHSFVGGQLSITVNGDLYRDANSATNLLLEQQPVGDYVVETKMNFDPNQNFQQAGLLVYSDDDHYIKAGASHHQSLNKIISGKESLEPLPVKDLSCDVQPSPSSIVAVRAYTRDQCPNVGEAWDYLTNPNPTENGTTAYNPTVTNWLRIYRHGNVYTPYSSLDGVHWVKGASWELTAAGTTFPVRIGLFAFSAGPHNDVPARFDYVHVYSLP